MSSEESVSANFGITCEKASRCAKQSFWLALAAPPVCFFSALCLAYFSRSPAPFLIICLLVMVPLTPVSSAIAIALGIRGFKSKYKKIAIWGIVIASIYMIMVAIMAILVALYPYYYGLLSPIM
ncbi:MAG: hypothetical protein FWH42_05080 [Dehalococcoidia bacterium]|nr:hypothetical protein [Dehalococcoidia bacterium]